MALSQDLRAALTSFDGPHDGRATSLLGEAEAEFGGQAGYIEALIALIGDAEPFVGSGATWLLKSYFEQGGALSAEQTQTLIAALPLGNDAHWSTQLHLCQSVRYLDLSGNGVSGPVASALWAWVEPLLTHKRPFLRAWSLDALAHLAREHPAYQAGFEKALQRASKDEAASVRARARSAIKITNSGLKRRGWILFDDQMLPSKGSDFD